MQELPADGPTVIVNSVAKSVNDHKLYKSVVLENGLVELELVFERREKRIAGHDLLDPAEIKQVAAAQELAVNIRAAANPIRRRQ